MSESMPKQSQPVAGIPVQRPGQEVEQWVARDGAVLSPSYTRVYPLVIERGRGSEVWDVEGRRYLDFNAGIAVAATGHSHPDVVRAIQRQAERFIHMSGTDFYYPEEIQLAERLDALASGDEPHQSFLCNSGAEAIEAALKLARYVTGRPRLLAFVGAFHGRTMGALSLTASKAVQRDGFAPLVPGVSHVPYAYCYRCAYHLEYPACDLACVTYIEETLFKHLVPPREVAAIFVEPIQGEGGYVVPPPEFHPRLKELADRHGILLVDDEVQAGIGRTGRMFAIEHWGVVPDIITVAKGLASGLPLGAAVARKSLMMGTGLPRQHLRRESRGLRGGAGDVTTGRERVRGPRGRHGRGASRAPAGDAGALRAVRRRAGQGLDGWPRAGALPQRPRAGAQAARCAGAGGLRTRPAAPGLRHLDHPLLPSPQHSARPPGGGAGDL